MHIRFCFLKRLLLSVVLATSQTSFAGTEPVGPAPSTTAPAASSALPPMNILSAADQAAKLNETIDCDRVDPSSDNAGKAHCKIVNDMATGVENLAVTAKTPQAQELVGEFNKFKASWESCVGKHKIAANLCLENLNENISQVTQVGGMIAASGSAALGANGACNKVANFMDIANKVLTIYNSACGAAQAYCNHSCKTAAKELAAVQQKVNQITCAPTETGCPAVIEGLKQKIQGYASQEANAGDKMSMAGKQELCGQKYGKLLMSGLAGVLSIMATLKAAKQCDQQTQAAEGEAVAGGEAPAFEPESTSCDDPARAATPECLCQKNPRMQGCANGLEKVGDAGLPSGINGLASNSSKSDKGGPKIDGLGPGDLGVTRDPSSAASSPGGSAGGGAGMGGSSGGPSGGAGEPGGSAGRKLDTNILAGTSGGGGGGGGWGRGGGSSGTTSGSKLGAYLPGGALDPKLNGNGMLKEVTGQGGKSNWEKVRERYRDNNGSLINH